MAPSSSIRMHGVMGRALLLACVTGHWFVPPTAAEKTLIQASCPFCGTMDRWPRFVNPFKTRPTSTFVSRNDGTIDRVDHVIETSPPEELRDVLDNLPQQLSTLKINPLHVSKSALTLVKSLKTMPNSRPRLRWKVPLSMSRAHRKFSIRPAMVLPESTFPSPSWICCRLVNFQTRTLMMMFALVVESKVRSSNCAYLSVRIDSIVTKRCKTFATRTRRSAWAWIPISMWMTWPTPTLSWKKMLEGPIRTILLHWLECILQLVFACRYG